MITGLTRPDAGRATIAGKPFAELANPARTVGTLLDAAAFHDGRTGRETLRIACTMTGVPKARADELLDAVGLSGDANRRVGGYSLGMRQRLGLAHALIGEPSVLILDEPANGLDPEGIAWIRTLLRDFAARGGTVLLSSHLLAEVQATADHLVIIDHGRVVASGTPSQPARRHRPDPRRAVPVPDHREGDGPMSTTATAIPFARLLRAEFRKATDTRAARWLLAATVLLALAAQAVPLVFPRDVTQDRASFLTWAALGLSRLLPIALMLTMTAEWSQRTALTTFTLEPRRGRVLAAKVAGQPRPQRHRRLPRLRHRPGRTGRGARRRAPPGRRLELAGTRGLRRLRRSHQRASASRSAARCTTRPPRS